MDYIIAFLVGGVICALTQILMEKTKMMPGRIMVLLVCLGAVLGAVQLFGKSAELYENREQTIAAIRKHMRNGVYSDIRNLQDLLDLV